LQVLFGSTPATSVTVLDDTRVVAVAPAGSGTVDVRVQSGRTTGSNPDNIKSPIFGYGISAITANDQFTYGTAPGNAAPTVATPASASPNPVNGTTTALSVLGADDGGEAALRYTWSSSGPASVTFSTNGSNAAKNATATFSQAGTYTFIATITDAAGLSVTSSAQVTVTQTATSIVVEAAPVITGQTLTYIVVTAPVRVKVGRKVQFRATALDQFGFLMAVQPIFTWKLSGKGKLSSTGLYTAPQRPGGPYTITVRSGTVSTTVKVIVDA
jgi:plastocyanin